MYQFLPKIRLDLGKKCAGTMGPVSLSAGKTKVPAKESGYPGPIVHHCLKVNHANFS